MSIIRTEEEILNWISKEQDFLEEQMDKYGQQTALFNQYLGSYDELQRIFEFMTEE